MAIFSTLRDLYQRHKRRLLITGSVISVVYLLQRYVKYKINEFQKKIAEENFTREQIRRRFEQTQKDALFTIIQLIPVLSKPIVEHLPTELITQSLKSKKTANKAAESTNLSLISNSSDELSNEKLNYFSKKSKVELWSQLKIKSITRVITLLYSITSLMILTRLQLNILARRSYLECAINMANITPSNVQNDQDYYSEQGFLSLSWFFLNKGWYQISQLIESKVEQVFHDVTVRTELSLNQFHELIAKTVQLVNLELDSVIGNIFPSNLDLKILVLDNTNPDLISQLYNENSTLNVLIDETNKYLTTDSMKIVFESMVNKGISTLFNNLSFTLAHTTGGDGNIEEVYKLASILAQLSVQSNVIITNEPINEYLNNLDEVSELDELSANVYSNFDDDN